MLWQKSPQLSGFIDFIMTSLPVHFTEPSPWEDPCVVCVCFTGMTVTLAKHRPASDTGFVEDNPLCVGAHYPPACPINIHWGCVTESKLELYGINQSLMSCQPRMNRPGQHNSQHHSGPKPPVPLRRLTPMLVSVHRSHAKSSPRGITNPLTQCPEQHWNAVVMKECDCVALVLFSSFVFFICYFLIMSKLANTLTTTQGGKQ